MAYVTYMFIKALMVRIAKTAVLAMEEFKAQLMALLNYRTSIAAPVRLTFTVGYYLDSYLQKKFARFMQTKVIQPIMDKDPVDVVIGSSKDGRKEFLKFRELARSHFTHKEYVALEQAFLKLNTIVPCHLARAAKEVRRDPSKLYSILSLIKSVRRVDKVIVDPYADPSDWIGDGLHDYVDDPLPEEATSGRLVKFYRRAMLAGISVQFPEGRVFVRTRDLFVHFSHQKYPKYRLLMERLQKWPGKHRNIVRGLFRNIYLDDYTFIKEVSVLLARKSTLRRGKNGAWVGNPGYLANGKSKYWPEERVDFISFSTGNDKGGLGCFKSAKARYSALRYKMNPFADTVKVKRAPGSSIHTAMDLGNLREHLIDVFVKTPFGWMMQEQSSTQGIYAIALKDDTFKILSDNHVIQEGNGLIFYRLFNLLQKLGLDNAKVFTEYLLNKGIGIYHPKNHSGMAKLPDGRELPVMFVMDGQEKRGFDAAFHVPGNRALRAYLEGASEVHIDDGVMEYKPVIATIDGVEVELVLGEIQIDVSIDGTAKAGPVHLGNPQQSVFAPKLWAALTPWFKKQHESKAWEIERLYQNLNKAYKIWRAIEQKSGFDFDKLKKSMAAKIFDELFGTKETVVPEGLSAAVEIVRARKPWQEQALTPSEIEAVLSSVGQPIVVKGIPIVPASYLIKIDAEGTVRTMISPELRMLIKAAVDSESRTAFYALEAYFMFLLKRCKKVFEVSKWAVKGRNATGADPRKTILPFKADIVEQIFNDCSIMQSPIVDMATANALIEDYLFYIHRDPTLDEVPMEQVVFEDLDIPVIINGYEVCRIIHSDDDNDPVKTYRL